ncbi:MAG: DUF4402 domain-containing protein [Negativicutes bacterium]|nr:DUF4402 domain-containing protein [Negativicutes bacterium]
MKTTILKFLTLSVAIFAFTNISFGQGNTASDNSTVGARIITPIAIENTASLEFGNLLETGSLYTVTLDPVTGTTTGASRPSGLEGIIQAASFSVTGELNATYSISVPSEAVTLTNGAAGEANSMTLDNFVPSKETGTISATGDTFTVGADLTVKASQEAGNYTGTFNVTVNYN